MWFKIPKKTSVECGTEVQPMSYPMHFILNYPPVYMSWRPGLTVGWWSLSRCVWVWRVKFTFDKDQRCSVLYD